MSDQALLHKLAYDGERMVPESMSPVDRVYHEHIARYRWACGLIVNLPAPPTVLDAPCGSGYGSAMIGELHPAVTVHGIDIDAQTIEYAGMTYGDENVHFAVRALEEPIGASYDAVVAFEGIEHVHDPELVARNLVGALKPGGMLLCSTPRKGGPGAGSDYHHREFATVAEFMALFGDLLNGIECIGQEMQPGDVDLKTARYWILQGRKPE